MSCGFPSFSLTPTIRSPPNVLAKAVACFSISSDHCSLKSSVHPSDKRSAGGSDRRKSVSTASYSSVPPTELRSAVYRLIDIFLHIIPSIVCHDEITLVQASRPPHSLRPTGGGLHLQRGLIELIS